MDLIVASERYKMDVLLVSVVVNLTIIKMYELCVLNSGSYCWSGVPTDWVPAGHQLRVGLTLVE